MTDPAVAWPSPAPPPGSAPQNARSALTWADTPSRLAAYILDSILVAFVAGAIIGVLGLGVVPLGSVTPSQDLDQSGTHLLAVVSTLVGAAYFVLWWSGGRRATPGQRVFGIQVGNAFDGRALTAAQAVRRWIGLGSVLGLFAYLPFAAAYGAVTLLQLLWAAALLVSTASSPTKQGLHDRFAGSAVVRPAGAGNRLALTCIVVFIALCVVAVVGFVALFYVGSQVNVIN